MKQLYSVLLAAAIATPALQADDFRYLREVKPTKGTEAFLYTYDEANRLVGQVHMMNEEINMSTRQVYLYDEAGRQTAEVTYQNLKSSDNLADYVEVNRFEYTFTDRGLVDTRNVYNYAGEGEPLMLSTVYRYHYDKQERLERIDIYPAGSDQVSQVFDYRYNSKGQLEARVTTFNGQMVAQASYSYDEKTGRIVQQINYTYYPEDHRLGIDLYVDYVYNEDGRLESIDQYNNTRLMLLRQLHYLYDEELTPFSYDQTVWPNNYELEMFGSEVPYFTLTNAPMYAYEERGFNEFSGLCELVDVYEFTYLTYPDQEPSGIATVNAGDSSTLAATVSGGLISLNGVEPEARIRVTDTAGRTLISGTYGTGINASKLSSGVYIISTAAGAAKIAL